MADIFYTLEAIDTYESFGPARSWQFSIWGTENKGVVGYRERQERRDETNERNFVGKMVLEIDELVKNISVASADAGVFATGLDDYLIQNNLKGVGVSKEENLKKFCEIQKALSDKKLNAAIVKDFLYGGLFSEMGSNLFESDGYALGVLEKPTSFWGKLKNFSKLPDDRMVKERKKIFDAYFSSSDITKAKDLWQLISRIPEKERSAFIASVFVVEAAYRDLTLAIERASSFEALKADPQKYLGKNKLDSMQYLSVFEKNYRKRKFSSELEESDAKFQDKEDLECAENEAQFVATVLKQQNPSLSSDVIDKLTHVRFVEIVEVRQKIEGISREAAMHEKTLPFDALLLEFKRDALKDRAQFEWYKKHKSVEAFFPDAASKDAYAKLTAEQVIEHYGYDAMSKYKNAVLIMEKIKAEKEAGKDVSSALKKLDVVLKSKHQRERSYQPDGIKAFMFDQLMEVGGKEVTKFSIDRDLWKSLAERMKGRSGQRAKEITAYVGHIMTDTVDVSKKKAALKKRLEARAKELEEGKNRVSDIQIADRIVEEIFAREAEGYKVNDPNKIVNRKKAEAKKEELTSQQKALIQRMKQGQRK